MQIQPVSIQLTKDKNRHAFTNLVLILDQPTFLEHVSEIRECWELSNTLEPQNLDNWLNTYNPNFKSTHWAVELLDNALERLELDLLHKNIDTYEAHSRSKVLAGFSRFDLEIGAISKRFNIPQALKDIIIKTIICGVLYEEDYSNLDLKVRRIKSNDWLYENTNLNLLYIKYGEADTKSDIVKDRKWHWQRKFKKSYKEIAEENPHIKSIGLEHYIKHIKERIKIYREFLKKGVVWGTPQN